MLPDLLSFLVQSIGTRMETPERIWFIMARNLSGEATDAEKEEWIKLLQENPQLMQQYDMMKMLWQPAAGDSEEPVEPGRIDHILELSAAEEQENDIEETPVVFYSRNHWRRTLIWAAVITGITLLIWYYIEPRSGHQLQANEIIARNGSKTRTILPDGSTAWLNAGSRLVCPQTFSGPNREVTLEGEAFFDIVKKKGQPFIVHAGNINIRVLGTAFNVKSYAEDTAVETTLIRGLVQITRKDQEAQPPIYLHPNQKIVVPKKNTEESQVQTDETMLPPEKKNLLPAVTQLDSNLKENERIETAWVYNRLEFRGDNFTALARKLERWYNIRIHFEDKSVQQLTFNGSLENETIEQAFIALKAAVPFGYVIKENEIYVKSVTAPIP